VSITVTVNGQSGVNVTAKSGDQIGVTVSPAGTPGGQGATGPAGASTSLAIGTVASGETASATITGNAPNQTLNLVLPQGSAGPQGAKGDTGSTGATGPANSLSIGTVSKGDNAAATITGTAPNQTLNLTLPKGDTGAQGPQGIQGPAGSVNLSDETPQPLGMASAGTALAAARADHVHVVPTIAYSSLTGIPSTFTPAAHNQAISTITGLQDALDGKQTSGTYATLVNGQVPSAQLPSFVDDVLEYANLAGFPATGEVGKIFVARDTNKTYRWSGSAYVEISPSPGSTDAVPEGSVNLYHTTGRAAAAAPVQSVAGRTGTITLTYSDIGGTPLVATTKALGAVIVGSGLTITDGVLAATGGGGGAASVSYDYATTADLPATGNAALLYCTTDTGRLYRWTGSVYAEVGPVI
jgi:hypothetical protein